MKVHTVQPSSLISQDKEDRPLRQHSRVVKRADGEAGLLDSQSQLCHLGRSCVTLMGCSTSLCLICFISKLGITIAPTFGELAQALSEVIE